MQQQPRDDPCKIHVRLQGFYNMASDWVAVELPANQILCLTISVRSDKMSPNLNDEA